MSNLACIGKRTLRTKRFNNFRIHTNSLDPVKTIRNSCRFNAISTANNILCPTKLSNLIGCGPEFFAY
jgi:hypothetical protein